jgi:hypothetical protein
MPANNYSIGKDVSLVIVAPSGVLTLPVTTTGFEARPMYNKVRTVNLDGINRGFNAPQGWEGSINLDRSNSVVDDFFAQQEAGYYAGQNTLTASISETVTEANGSVTQWRYTGVILSFDEAGKFTGDNKVSQAIGFFASQKIKVA